VRAFHSERSPRAGCDVHASTPNLASTKKVCAKEALSPEFSLTTYWQRAHPCIARESRVVVVVTLPIGCLDHKVSSFQAANRFSVNLQQSSGDPLSAQCHVVAPCRPLEISFPQVERVFGWYTVSTSLSAVTQFAFSFRILKLAGGLHCSLLYQQILLPPKHLAPGTPMPILVDPPKRMPEE
jgi:hypothetical protein